MSEVPSTMRAVVCHGPEDYRLEQIDVPVPGEGEALVRVEAVGICASDLKCYHGAAKFWGDDTRPAWAETGVVPGHEFTGEVVALDATARERWGISQLLPDQTIGACYGDALLAGIGVGAVPPTTDWTDLVREVTPDPGNRAVYDEVFATFEALYPATRPQVHDLARLAERTAR